MTSFLSVFDNRELAIIFWALFALLFILSKKKLRNSLLGIFKKAFLSKLGLLFALITLYVLGIIYCLYCVGFWNGVLLKESVFWLLGFAFLSLNNVIGKSNYRQYFKKLILDTFTVTLILGFIVDFYVMPLWIEIVMLPVLIFASLLYSMSKHMEKEEVKFRMTTKLFNGIIYIISASIFFYSLYSFVINPSAVITADNFRELILPVILTITYVPLLHIIGVYCLYEVFFIRLRAHVQDKLLIKYVKRQIVLTCKLNLDKINRVQSSIIRQGIKDKKQLHKLLKEA